MSIAPGTKLGQYEVQDFIGQGAMGLVYRAYHPQLERTGAVKILQAISPDADTVARFRHEAQAIAQLRHPNIVNVYDFGEFQGTPYMIVEYVPGGSLAGKMSEGQLDPDTALKYMRGIAAGLDYAHSHGVVHRDVKPANVLLTEDNTPVLADFGLAKLMQGTSLKSMTGVTTGTPAYMAPEQVTGAQVTPAADRYSLATIAYEMLTGVIPFDGEALMELLYAQVHREPIHPSARNVSLGPQVDAVIMRGLAKDPAARWESCTAFVDALAAAMDGAAVPVPVGAARTLVMAAAAAATVPLAGGGGPAVPSTLPLRPESTRPRPASPGTVVVPYPGPAAEADDADRKKSRRRLIAMIAGGLIALLILLAVVGLLVTRGGPTLTLSQDTVAPGEDIVVTATHVPKNQSGQIEMFSVEHQFPFRADTSGQVSLDITVPRDIGFGDHLVKLCYSGLCHAQQTLHVVTRVALASPTPVGNPTPSASPSPTATSTPTPTAGSTPRPGGGGGGSGGGGSGSGGGGGGPTPAPTAPPQSTPTPPPPNPCPTSSSSPRLTESPAAVVAGVTAVTITGSYFTPNQPVTVRYYLGSSLKKSLTTTVSCGGAFSVTFTPALLDVGSATVTAQDNGGRSASVKFSIT